MTWIEASVYIQPKGFAGSNTTVILYICLVAGKAHLSKRFKSLSFTPVRLKEEDSSKLSLFFQDPDFHCLLVADLRKLFSFTITVICMTHLFSA